MGIFWPLQDSDFRETPEGIWHIWIRTKYPFFLYRYNGILHSKNLHMLRVLCLVLSVSQFVSFILPQIHRTSKYETFGRRLYTNKSVGYHIIKSMTVLNIFQAFGDDFYIIVWTVAML